jgi:hypothetical protein
VAHYSSALPGVSGYADPAVFKTEVSAVCLQLKVLLIGLWVDPRLLRSVSIEHIQPTDADFQIAKEASFISNLDLDTTLDLLWEYIDALMFLQNEPANPLAAEAVKETDERVARLILNQQIMPRQSRSILNLFIMSAGLGKIPTESATTLHLPRHTLEALCALDPRGPRQSSDATGADLNLFPFLQVSVANFIC